MKWRIALICIFFILGKTARAQSDSRLGSWTIFNITSRLTDRWSLWGELQLRSFRFYNYLFYYETKGGPQYKINSSATVQGGIGRYTTFSDGGNFHAPRRIEEFRTWAELKLKNRIGRISLEHRYRVEQRWQNSVYRNRFRYRLSAVLPLNHTELLPKTMYAAVNSEAFLSNIQPHFLRNRMFGGVGYSFDAHYTAQAGLLYQYDYQGQLASVRKKFFQLTLLVNVGRKFAPADVHPAVED